MLVTKKSFILPEFRPDVAGEFVDEDSNLIEESSDDSTYW